MSRRKVVVKRLNAIQNFGAMDVLCTDKTGTLTGIASFSSTTSTSLAPGITRCCTARLNSFHQSGMKNLMDRAVIRFGRGKPGIEARPFQQGG